MDLQQGDCIRIPDPGLTAGLTLHPGVEPSQDQLYQVVSIDAAGDRCWLRRWPLARHGSPVFELSLRQLQDHQPHRPHLRGRS